jgi:hypothetical protein
MRMSNTVRIIFAISMLASFAVAAQENPGYKKLISETNRRYGSNDMLHSGEIYRPEHTLAKGNPYFVTNDYVPISISVKENKFENITGKYNIETGQLMILTPADSNSIIRITVKQSWVDSFIIQSHSFVNISNWDSSGVLKGFYELVYHGRKSLFIKYRKGFIDTYNDLSPYGFYSTVKKSFFIFDGIKFSEVKSKKNFLMLQEASKSAVKKYMRVHKIKFLKASSDQLKKLMQFSDGTAVPD